MGSDCFSAIAKDSAILEGVENSSEKVLVNFAYGSDADEREEGARIRWQR
jgi:hypothetical protein